MPLYMACITASTTTYGKTYNHQRADMLFNQTVQ